MKVIPFTIRDREIAERRVTFDVARLDAAGPGCCRRRGDRTLMEIA